MAKAHRIASIDLIRAITMLLMLFVNDFAGMGGIPHWLQHAETNEDMLGFSDIIFPSFLFCMGLSLPFAIESRKRKGDTPFAIIVHILTRSLALILLGLFSMNCSSVEGGLNHQWFCILMIVGFFLVWNQYPDPPGNKRKKGLWQGLRALGAALLIFLVVHRLVHGYGIVVGWWGILGLIGWAYLFSGLFYMCVLKRLGGVIACLAVIFALDILNFSGVSLLGIIPGGWTHIGLAFTRVTASSLMMYFTKKEQRGKFIGTCLGVGVLMLVLGLVSHTQWIISKNLATPTWMFFCLSIDMFFLALAYYICDYKKVGVLEGRVAGLFLQPAAKVTIVCYLLPTVTSAVRQLLGLSYPHVISYGGLGLCKSLVFSFVIILIAGLLSRVNIRLKL